MDLLQIYSDLLLEIGIPQAEINKLWLTLEKAYTSPSRKYHNLTHIEAMISSFEVYKNQLQFPNEVLYAIFYHDIIYETTQNDNEQKSAEYAISILPENTTLNQQLVYDMICATQFHQQNPIEDINWLIDFDLRILASDWEQYEMYYQQIREEYKNYPDLLYQSGRKKVLKDFFKNKFVFQTEEFRTKYEAKARENIQKEINQL